MDWEAKMPSWDLGTVVGPSGGAGGGGGLDLKLGGPTSWRRVPAAVAAPSSSPTPAKRARAGQAPACSVEGCAADLSRCREYHRRHKVCEAHSKTPVVSVAGQQQRFCQQCSRFHLLVEFDEVKRSCRKRLDGHNRRRRKQQPDPLGPAGLFANHHGGTRFASYPQIFSTTTSMAPEHKWPGSIAIKTEADVFQVEQYYSSLQLNGAANAASLFHGKERSKRFPFLSDHHGDTAFQQQPFTITPSSESSSNSSSRHSNGNKMFAANDGGPDHNCALSLLSDSPTTQAAHTMITAAAQHFGGARIHYSGGGGGDGGGGVSLTGLSYASGIMGDNKGSAHAAMATSTRHAGAVTTASSVAAQLQQYHGYYQHQVNGDQGNSADAGASMQALPFSSW